MISKEGVHSNGISLIKGFIYCWFISCIILLIMTEKTDNQDLTFDIRQRKIDNILNKTVMDIALYSVIGWSIGLGAGLFFHRAAPIRNLIAGVGGSYGFVVNKVHLKKYS